MEIDLKEGDLDHFYGSDEYYSRMGLKYTQGVKYMADHGGAHWLIDAIASYQPTIHRSKAAKFQEVKDFHIWELKVDRTKGSAVLTCKADTNHPVAIEQKIERTDFPLDYIKIWVEYGMAMLPQER